MKAQQALDYFDGSIVKLAEVTKVERQNVYYWLKSKKGMVPLVRALLIQQATQGVLAPNPMDYLDLNRHGQGRARAKSRAKAKKPAK